MGEGGSARARLLPPKTAIPRARCGLRSGLGGAASSWVAFRHSSGEKLLESCTDPRRVIRTAWEDSTLEDSSSSVYCAFRQAFAWARHSQIFNPLIASALEAPGSLLLFSPPLSFIWCRLAARSCVSRFSTVETQAFKSVLSLYYYHSPLTSILVLSLSVILSRRFSRSS